MKSIWTKKSVNESVTRVLCGAMLIGAAGTAGIQSAVAADSITAALADGKGSVDLRLRYEGVDQDGMDKSASAVTLRTRLGYATGDYMGVSGFVQMDDVSAIGDENYNSTVNGNTQYPVVADPTGTEVNQAFLKYSAADTTVKWGRQEVVLDNARFVGNVGWRQNAQSYDGLTIANSSVKDLSVVYGYVTNVNRIFGEQSANSDIDTQTHLLNVSYSGLPYGKLTGYAYLLDLTDAPTASNQTTGLRFAGGTAVAEGTKLLYTAEFASQTKYKDGADSIDATYSLVELGVNTAGVTAKLGMEMLGGDGTYGFSTPLATLHAFNGWTDKFLATPANGLVDTYVTVGGKVAGTKLALAYHTFSADEGGADYGTELGLLAAKKFGDHYKVVAKYASYSADSFSVDTDKVWLMGQASF